LLCRKLNLNFFNFNNINSLNLYIKHNQFHHNNMLNSVKIIKTFKITL